MSSTSAIVVLLCARRQRRAAVEALLKSGAMSAEQVAPIPQCGECGEVWLPADGDRWRAYLDTDAELVFYCPECAKRELSS
jgi:hypothetical protein